MTQTPPPISIPLQHEAIVDGANARRAGKLSKRNPYQYPTPESHAWNSGWMRPSHFIGEPT